MKITRICRRLFCIGASLLMMSSCHETVENKYAGFPAYFIYKYVNTVPPLNTALNSMGVFTTIRANRGQYLFTAEDGKTTAVNATALENYQSFKMGIAGFIVGLPNIPELGSEAPQPVCYDLACPNCYNDLHIERSLQLKEGGYASCSSCQRIYNLNDQGLIASGTEGSSLLRYRMSYSGNTIVINNQ